MNQTEKRLKWFQILEEQKQSQLSIKTFCQQNQISYQTFYYWSKRLNDTEEQQKVQPIVIDDVSHQVITVILQNGLRVELPCSLSKSQIQTWIEALQ
jgi:hypothetical protein